MAVMLVSPVLRTTTLRPKQESLWQWTISSPVDLVFAANHTKSNFRVFSTAVNISICIILLISVTSETRTITRDESCRVEVSALRFLIIFYLFLSVSRCDAHASRRAR